MPEGDMPLQDTFDRPISEANCMPTIHLFRARG